MARIHEHTVNIAAPLTLVRAIPLAMQGDAEADALILHVVNGKESADMTGYAVGGYLERADGIRVMLKGSVTADMVEVKLQEACYRVPGAYKAFVRMTKTTGEKMTLFLFAGRIEGEGDGEIVDEEDTLPRIEELIAMIEEIDRAIAEANEARDGANAAATRADVAAAEALKAAENAGKAEKAANDAAYEANAAADAADEAAVGASAWAKATMEAESLPEGREPTISVEKNVNGGNVIRVGIPAGKTGDTGETGATPQITFEVETGEAGTDVKVEQSGTAEAPHIKLTIPRGDTGAVEGVDYYEGEPAPLGAASPGTSNGLARGNHVHPMPTAEQVGARPNTWTPTAADVGALGKNETAANANQLNGKSADQYALKTDLPTKAADVGALPSDGTAADSAKLGGKAPEYYLQPRNLLDNSDFTNPVNQRGQTTYASYFATTFDRWLIASESQDPSVTATVSKTSAGLKFSAASNGKVIFGQRLPAEALSKNKTYTAVSFKSNGMLVWGEIGDFVETFGFWSINFNLSNNDVLVWAALYEGEYTADNLPPYVPKGYAAELAECQRYYYKFNDANGVYIPVAANSDQIAGFLFPTEMRIAPTTTLSKLEVWDARGFTSLIDSISSKRATKGSFQYIQLTEKLPDNGLISMAADFSADL